jgi:arginine decarboxylase
MSAAFADTTDVDLTVHERRLSAVRNALHIPILTARGSGPTALSAFDAALLAAGVANYNLVRLSSVIPPGTTIVDGGDAPGVLVDGEWGDRLYCVFARQDAATLGEEAWAGIAWVQDPESGAGLFVEHEGHSEGAVRADLSASISALCRNRGLPMLTPHERIIGTACEGEPVTALVIAPYLAAGWG